jgi:two-component system invasion response regulator UvrY
MARTAGRLYLVDDHVIVREGLRAVLESAGHRVLGESADPLGALPELLRLVPDVLLLDLQLGAGTGGGLELLAELQRRALPLRVIVLTMSAHAGDVAEALRLGADGYLLKGSPATELLAAIDAVRDGRKHLGEGVAELAVQALDAPAADPLATLSPRERQIVRLVVSGASSAAIGAQLHLSPKTVDTYRSRLMAKLEVRDVPALVRWAIRSGLIDAAD